MAPINYSSSLDDQANSLETDIQSEYELRKKAQAQQAAAIRDPYSNKGWGDIVADALRVAIPTFVGYGLGGLQGAAGGAKSGVRTNQEIFAAENNRAQANAQIDVDTANIEIQRKERLLEKVLNNQLEEQATKPGGYKYEFEKAKSNWDRDNALAIANAKDKNVAEDDPDKLTALVSSLKQANPNMTDESALALARDPRARSDALRAAQIKDTRDRSERPRAADAMKISEGIALTGTIDKHLGSFQSYMNDHPELQGRSLATIRGSLPGELRNTFESLVIDAARAAKELENRYSEVTGHLYQGYVTPHWDERADEFLPRAKEMKDLLSTLDRTRIKGLNAVGYKTEKLQGLADEVENGGSKGGDPATNKIPPKPDVLTDKKAYQDWYRIYGKPKQ